MGSWSKKNVETLIRLYESNPILYNTYADGYYNNNKREAVYFTMAKELSKSRPTTVVEVRKKLTTLRSQYRTEKAQRALKDAGLNATYVPKLWCYDLLTFLDNHVNRKKGEVEADKASGTKLESKREATIQIASLTGNTDLDKALQAIPAETTIWKNKSHTECSVNEVMTDISLDNHNGDKDETNEDFAKYIVSELEKITDENLLFETKFAIQGIINDANLRMLEQKNDPFQ